MPLKTLLFNNGLFIQGLRSTGWIGIIYLLCLLFSLPLQLLMASSEESYRHHYYFNQSENLFFILPGFQVFLMFAIPTLLAIFLFRFLQVKQSADYLHSLPIKRETMFHQQLILGLLLLVLPVFFTSIILFILSGFLDGNELLSFWSILYWMLMTLLINIFVLMAGVFVGMFTGMSVLQGILLYIMLLFPAGVTVLIFMNLEYFLFGFTAEYYLNKNIEKMIPFYRVGEMMYQPFTAQDIYIYLILIVVFYVISLVVYKKRDVEAANQAIAFSSLRPIFKYGVTLCFMLVGGLYFGETRSNELGWILFGYISASLLGYAVAEIVLQKTWRIANRWKGYLYFAGTMLIVGIILQLDPIGYEKRLPDIQEVNRVYFGESVYFIEERRNNEVDWVDVQGKAFGERLYFYKNNESITKIQELHGQLLNDKANLKNKANHFTRPVYFGYEMENGKMIIRKYNFPRENYLSTYQAIIDTNEHRENFYPLLRITDLSDLEFIHFQSYRYNKSLTISDKLKLEQLHVILQEEMRNESSEVLLEEREPWAEIQFYWKDNKRFTVPWRKSYKRVEEWLEQEGLLEQARVTADDIIHAVILKKEEGQDIYKLVDRMSNIGEIEMLPNAIKVEDNIQLEEFLKKSSWNKDRSYVIAFYSKNESYPIIEMLNDEDVPSNISQQFD